MAWSTREVAQLAGVSLRAVRHYHEVGLLTEPERRPNGYKQYGVAHLVRLLRIKRLVGLGFSLPRIAEMGADDGPPEEALRALDAELSAEIEKLEQSRAEVGSLLRKSAAERPEPEEEHPFVAFMGTVLGPRGKEAYAGFVRDHGTETAGPLGEEGEEFAHLPADADESARADLATRMAPGMRALFRRHPGLDALSTDAPRGARFARQAIDAALADLYNPAQVDVVRRLRALLAGAKAGAEQHS
ncbi:MerR family transcriptional regulator [Streptomyces sp. ODS28]|uniref:MerR family transcriptional regulator n=1 Tax=Streptomyces sp. ODS28 TaxID=3136688 RepID=UPI0031E504FC